MQNIPCFICGNPVAVYPNKLKRNAHFFCSRECQGIFKSQNLVGEKSHRYASIKVKCSQCGDEVVRNPFQVDRNDNFFCKRACYDEWRRTHFLGENNPNYIPRPLVPCAQCGKLLDRAPHRTANYEKQFCDMKCHGKWDAEHNTGSNSPVWKGGWQDCYGPNWDKQRRAAIKRDSGHCQHCGKGRGFLGIGQLHVHHLTPFREFGFIPEQNDNYLQANDLKNLITLCGSCHSLAEWGKISVQPKLL